MYQIQLRSRRESKSVQALLGKRAKPEDFGLLLTENAEVYKPNGDRLLTLVRGGIDASFADDAYPFLHAMRKHKSANRGTYSGKPKRQVVKRDGTLSNTSQTEPVASVVVGFMDKNPRFPFCRETILSSESKESWGACLPMIRNAASVFRAYAPGRYDNQLREAHSTHSSYVIPGTPFTTLTINNCIAGSYHTDKGDYGPGFGVMSVSRCGSYQGCLLGFPAYGVAVDLQDRDVILFDPHEIHGNTDFYDQVGVEGEDWERISVVYYFRSKMRECKSPAEELLAGKQLRGAL